MKIPIDISALMHWIVALAISLIEFGCGYFFFLFDRIEEGMKAQSRKLYLIEMLQIIPWGVLFVPMRGNPRILVVMVCGTEVRSFGIQPHVNEVVWRAFFFRDDGQLDREVRSEDVIVHNVETTGTLVFLLGDLLHDEQKGGGRILFRDTREFPSDEVVGAHVLPRAKAGGKRKEGKESDG